MSDVTVCTLRVQTSDPVGSYLRTQMSSPSPPAANVTPATTGLPALSNATP